MRDTRRSEQPEPTEHYIFQDSQTVVLECGFPWNSVPDRDPLALERITAHRAVRALAELCEGLIRPMTLGMTSHDNKLRRVRVPLERADGHFWVTAPETGVWYPFQLRVDKSCGTVYPDGREYDEFIELTIDVNWSFWWHSGDGRARLDQAVGRLLRQGWRHAHPQTGPRA
ncbi:hypothetical protein [Streptomyces sp. NRRL S-1813]|uniref:hypothetical protein n=1 Tax=Streptomyces sp. NRRL S-1813 TaxID=1463888 RepID=UPI0004CAB2B2|nr:hypothetical protein [Streptomyces sp. NRRL S-1813]